MKYEWNELNFERGNKIDSFQHEHDANFKTGGIGWAETGDSGNKIIFDWLKITKF